MFIDEAKIRIKAGDGGNGCMAFRREKFVPRGGPSGGDGGRGGDIVLESSERHNTLIHFRFNPEYKGERGRHGEGSNCTGRSGHDLILKAPVGTVVYDAVSGERLHDFTRPDERYVAARGGRGGRGNQHFATPTHQAPREHELGFPGEERTLRLELKLLADVGLVGYPNVGKSTLISRISAARPKIADYAFTTLQPNLGVVSIGETLDEESYVVADIPGLIEGAHLGHGLGVQFLRHIERTRLLAHLIDVSDSSGRPNPAHDFEVIMNELASFGAGLAEKPMVVVATKLDVANPGKLAKLKRHCERRKLPLMAISAVTGEDIQRMKYGVGAILRQMREGKYQGPQAKPLPVEKILGAVPAKKKAAMAKAGNNPKPKPKTKTKSKLKPKTATKKSPSKKKTATVSAKRVIRKSSSKPGAKKQIASRKAARKTAQRS